MSGYENLGTNDGAFNPSSIDDHYKFIYFETLDTVIVSVTDRFEQPSYKFFSYIEQLLLNSIDGKPHDEEKWQLMLQYFDDIDESSLSSELEILRTICKADKLINFDDIIGRI